MSVMKEQFRHLSISQLIRIRNIEVMIDNYGYCQRKVLADLGGTSIATAARDISEYTKMSDGVYYNRQTKRIEKTSLFKRIF